MSNDYTALVSKVWNYAHVLRDQGCLALASSTARCSNST